MRTSSADPSHGRFFAKPPNSSEQKPTLVRRVSRPLPSSSMREEERRSRGGYSTIFQSLQIGVGLTHRNRLGSLQPCHLQISGSYSHIPWAQTRPPFLRSRLAPKESSLPKGKPAGRESRGGRERTCLIWPRHHSMDQSRQHDLQLQHPRP